jgi:dipeptidase E
MELLLLSNSTNKGGSFLGHAGAELDEFLVGVRNLAFVPFALAQHDDYTDRVRAVMEPRGIRVTGLHEGNPLTVLERSDAVFTGGGNTFRLVDALYRAELIEPLRTAVAGGVRYMGASAGTNIAAPTLKTTNDMPIVEPPSFRTLGLVPFQINPHYVDPDPASGHNGETRAERIEQFHEENDVPVLGLREGTHLRVTSSGSGPTASIGGRAVNTAAPGPALLFRQGARPTEVSGDVSDLLA